MVRGLLEKVLYRHWMRCLKVVPKPSTLESFVSQHSRFDDLVVCNSSIRACGLSGFSREIGVSVTSVYKLNGIEPNISAEER